MKRLFVISALAITATACTAPGGGEAGSSSNPSGKFVFQTRSKGGCVTCHKTTDQKLVGPGLAGIGERHSDEWLKAWIDDPEKVWNEDHPETVEMKKRLGKEHRSKPGMKLLNPLSEAEIDALVKYLNTL